MSTTYLSRPVFDFGLNWQDTPAHAFKYSLNEIQFDGFGPLKFAPTEVDAATGFAFRPLVDLHVAKLRRPQAADECELTPADKVALVGLLNVDMRMPRGEMTVLSAIEQATEALVRLFDGGSEAMLELPVLIGLRQHRLEA